MAAMAKRPPGAQPPAENDIYTVLLVIATGFIVGATICLIYQFSAYFGLENLFAGSSPLGE